MSVPPRSDRLCALEVLDRAGGELPLRALKPYGGARLVGAKRGERAFIVRTRRGARITDAGMRALLRAEGEQPYEPRRPGAR